ncbi:MAG: hypothetical protein IKY83_11845 [Proteobacteria bacterium]|nr:hypothetical protein [Pseudomonadota bacterium]
MKSFHKLNWAMRISLSILVVSFTLAACSKKAPEPETPKTDVVEKAGDGEVAADTEAKAEGEQVKEDIPAAEGSAAQNVEADPKEEAENSNGAPAEAQDDIKWEVPSQPPIAKSIDDEFEFPKCMVCRYCKANREEGEDIYWSSGSECRLSAAQVDKIIKKGAVNQWNEYGQTPLMLANDLKSVQKLLAAGASPEHTDEFGNDAMDYALTKEIQQALIKAGYKTGESGEEYALFDAKPYNKIDEDIGDYIKEAKKRAANPSKGFEFNSDTTWSDGDAAYGHGYRDDRIIRGWIKKAKDVNARDEDGRTPLFYINYPKEARLLLAAGADINAQDNDGNTPLLWFMSNNQFEDEDPDTRRTEDIIAVLIAAGADTSITNKAGMSAKDYKKLGK